MAFRMENFYLNFVINYKFEFCLTIIWHTFPFCLNKNDVKFTLLNILGVIQFLFAFKGKESHFSFTEFDLRLQYRRLNILIVTVYLEEISYRQ
jgi:hypothetical protein